jgi:hypothetical protein
VLERYLIQGNPTLDICLSCLLTNAVSLPSAYKEAVPQLFRYQACACGPRIRRNPGSRRIAKECLFQPPHLCKLSRTPRPCGSCFPATRSKSGFYFLFALLRLDTSATPTLEAAALRPFSAGAPH